MREIRRDNCEGLTGLTYESVLALTGITSIHSIENFENDENVECLISYDPDNERIEVDIETELIEVFKVSIYLDRKFIQNNEFKKKKSCKIEGLAFARLYSQVYAAKKHGFDKLKLYAYGKTGSSYHGHLLWGKFGFQMADPDQMQKFLKLMKDNNIEVSNMYEAMQDTKALEIIKEKGQSWYGDFDLTDESPSMRILEKEKKLGRAIKLIV